MKSGPIIQIIFTNDLHSMFKGVESKGGYARIKTVINQLKNKADEENIESLILDGGDFSEGSSFYLVDEGIKTFQALDLLGYDAAVLGNHDHLLGEYVLVEQIRRSDLNTKLLSANLTLSPRSSLGELIQPGYTFVKNGINIRVIGLSTPELLYQYSFEEGFIIPPYRTARTHSEEARTKGADLIIALTHLGVESDRYLARSSDEIDVVVGGHSHSRLEKPIYEKNRNSKRVPIVQSGALGETVGSLYIQLQRPGNIKVLKHKLYDVNKETNRNKNLKIFIDRAVMRRNKFFDGRWNEPLGRSNIKLTGNHYNNKKISSWEKHQSRMIRDAAGTELGMHIRNFNGITIKKGEITYGDIIDNMPRVRFYGDEGWRIGHFNLEGWNLLGILKVMLNHKKLDFSFSSLTWYSFKIPGFIPFIGNRHFIWWVKAAGRRLNSRKNYSLAFPSEIAYAVRRLLPRAKKHIFTNFNEPDLFYWPLMEKYIRKNSPLQKI